MRTATAATSTDARRSNPARDADGFQAKENGPLARAVSVLRYCRLDQLTLTALHAAATALVE
jgi:hypothetical protein